MKKRLLALLLAVISVLALAGCGSKKDITGNWKSDSVDLAEVIGEKFAETDGLSDYAEALTPDKFEMVLYWTFNEDGTFELTTDTDKMQQEWNTYAKKADEVMSAVLVQIIEAEGISVETFLAYMGMDSIDEVLEASLGSSVEEYFKSYGEDIIDESTFEATGTWTRDGKEITLVNEYGDSTAYWDEEADVIYFDETGYDLVFRRTK